ncbi:hypothetical protein DXG01_001035 [Tephrocybe rancida]|nr:hypothetical protein DXG01_001035 [Tephrocybe rancida]
MTRRPTKKASATSSPSSLATSSLGIAYQLVEDTQEYELHGSSTSRLLVAGPILFADEQHPDLQPLIRCNLAGEGDVEQAGQFVSHSDGIERTRQGTGGTLPPPDSDYKIALDALVDSAVNEEVAPSDQYTNTDSA